MSEQESSRLCPVCDWQLPPDYHSDSLREHLSQHNGLEVFLALRAEEIRSIRPGVFAIVDYPDHSLHGETVRVVGLYKPTTWSIRARESADGKSFTSCAFEESRLRPTQQQEAQK